MKYDKLACMYGMVLCVAKLSSPLWLAHVKTDVEAHEMIQSYGLVYSINREKPHQPITFSFVERMCLEYSDQNVHFR